MQKKVRIFPQTQDLNATKSKMNVAAYCRVSTMHTEQEQSLQTQVLYYENHILSHPDWTNAGVFCDAKSGKSAQKRSGFQSLMRLCRRGKIDLILTKSVSRMGRNYSELLQAFHELRHLEIDIWFESNDLRLLDLDTRVLLELYAAFAAAESEVKSEIIRWGIQESFRSGNGKKSALTCYGYRKDHDGLLTPHPFEAQIVNFIFQLYLEGSSLQKISQLLTVAGITSPTGRAEWSRETIRKILTNEKYIGEVLHQKTYVDSLESGHRKKNRGDVDQYRIEHHHSPIISRGLFERAACELNARRRHL